MNRRKIILVIITILIVGLLIGCSSTEPPQTVATLLDLLRADAALTPEGATEIALLADALADSIEELYPESLRDIEQAQGFLFEIMAYSVYERILPETSRVDIGGGEWERRPSHEVMPLVEMRHYWGDSTFHLMGTASCWDPSIPIDINVRYFNPASPMYDKASSQVSVLIHETMHMQGVCPQDNKGSEHNVNVESATQVATLEVLAAMTRHRNKYGLLPFLREIQGFAADLVLLRALENDDLDTYRREILIPTANDAYRLAAFEKSMDHWLESYALTFRLKEIITQYGYKPYTYIIEALKDDDYETVQLPFPNPKGTIHLNDVAYVLENLSALVDDYHKII